MTEQLTMPTTFRRDLGDGRELHHSTPARVLTGVDEATLEAVLALGELYDKGDIDPGYKRGIALPLGRQYDLGRMPVPNLADRRSPEFTLFPVFNPFCNFLYRERGALLDGRSANYVRVTGFGVEAPKETNLHCDIEREWYDLEGKRCIRSRAFPDTGRLVLGLDTRLRDDLQANLLVMNGDFTVDGVVVEPEGVPSLEDLDAVRPSGTLVTRDTHSVIEVFDPATAPDSSVLTQTSNGQILDLGSTTLHAGSSIGDAMRVSLQCWYQTGEPS